MEARALSSMRGTTCGEFFIQSPKEAQLLEADFIIRKHQESRKTLESQGAEGPDVNQESIQS